jgi:hypothetical protein
MAVLSQHLVYPQATLSELLIQGGDERIAIDATTGLNRYGCGAAPDCREIAFGSSTASPISQAGFGAATSFSERLASYHSAQEAYAVEAQGIRERLAALCGLPLAQAQDIALAPSGTDLHLIVADMSRGGANAPLKIVLPDPDETGRGVPAAVSGRRFATQTPYGGASPGHGSLPGFAGAEVVVVKLRQSDGSPRDAKLIDDDFERATLDAAKTGARVLLILVDVSKTGLIAPSLDCALGLKAHLGEALTVLVDACQFRLSGTMLGAYLARDLLVAVTGSKFLGGPPFSGALFVPPASSSRLRRYRPLPALADYSSRYDWPPGWAAHAALQDAPNVGLLLRWEAALHEFSAFRLLREDDVRDFSLAFADIVDEELARRPALRALPTPPPKRAGHTGWDQAPTIFSFVGLRDGRVAHDGETEAVFWSMLKPPTDGSSGKARPVRLGQPVRIGNSSEGPATALRLSLGARDIVRALGSAADREAVIAGALEALARADQAFRGA